MKVEKVKLFKSKIRDQILLSEDVENFLLEVGEGIGRDLQQEIEPDNKVEVSAVEERTSRVAVDVAVDRTWEIFENKTLEKVVEKQ